MDKRTEKKEILNSIHSQISSFDNKASILVTVVSVVSALSLSLINVFFTDNFISKNDIFKSWFGVLFILLFIVSFLAITFFVLAIIPRKKMGTNIYADYYKDISEMNEEEYSKHFDSFIKNDYLLIKQILINSKIATKKHFWIKIGAWFLPIYGLVALSLVIMTMLV